MEEFVTSAITEETGTSLQHAFAQIEPGVSIHYVSAGSGARTVVLLHGFPQTWRAWRHVMPRLVDEGFRVIAPDYRGAGNSSRPPSGYDKRTMASDIYRLLYEHLKLSSPVAMVGHDIGLIGRRMGQHRNGGRESDRFLGRGRRDPLRRRADHRPGC